MALPRSARRLLPHPMRSWSQQYENVDAPAAGFPPAGGLRWSPQLKAL